MNKKQEKPTDDWRIQRIQRHLARYSDEEQETIKNWWRFLSRGMDSPYPLEDRLQELEIWQSLPKEQVISQISSKTKRLKPIIEKLKTPPAAHGMMIRSERFLTTASALLSGEKPPKQGENPSLEEQINAYLAPYGEEKEVVLSWLRREEEKMGKRLSPKEKLTILQSLAKEKPERIIEFFKNHPD